MMLKCVTESFSQWVSGGGLVACCLSFRMQSEASFGAFLLCRQALQTVLPFRYSWASLQNNIKLFVALTMCVPGMLGDMSEDSSLLQVAKEVGTNPQIYSQV